MQSQKDTGCCEYSTLYDKDSVGIERRRSQMIHREEHGILDAVGNNNNGQQLNGVATLKIENILSSENSQSTVIANISTDRIYEHKQPTGQQFERIQTHDCAVLMHHDQLTINIWIRRNQNKQMFVCVDDKMKIT